MPVRKSRPMVGSAMLTTVASSAATPDPSTVTASTQRPGAEEYERAGTSAVVMSRHLLSPDRGRSTLGAGSQGDVPPAHKAGVAERGAGELDRQRAEIRGGADVVPVQDVLAQG